MFGILFDKDYPCGFHNGGVAIHTINPMTNTIFKWIFGLNPEASGGFARSPQYLYEIFHIVGALGWELPPPPRKGFPSHGFSVGSLKILRASMAP